MGRLTGHLSTPQPVSVQENKNAYPKKDEYEVTPDDGYDALGKVTVAPDLALKASQLGSTSAVTVLDFSDRSGIDFGGWGQYFRSRSEDTSTIAGSSAWGNAKKCKIKLPKNCTQIHSRAFSGMSGLVELDASAVEGSLFVGSRAIFGNPLLATAGTAFWEKLKSVTTNSIRPSTGNGVVSIFEEGNDISAPNLDTVVLLDGYDSYCFAGCGFKSFTAQKLPRITDSMFFGCGNMVRADFTDADSIAYVAFSGCTSLTDLTLRHNSVVTLSNTNAFSQTPAMTAPATFTLHVPADLVDSYKAATNWVSLYNGGSGINIVAIQEGE